MRTIGLFALLGACLPATEAAEPFRQVLTSASHNVQVDAWQATGKEVTPACAVPWSVRKQRLHGGKQEGVDIVIIDNGKLQLTVVPTRGMGLLSVTLGEVRLGWDSPVKEVVHPNFINLQSRGGLGWLEGFNEFVCRCGLESNGQPGTDKFVNNVGDEATMELTLHGKIANAPAGEVEVLVEREPPFRIHVRGRVDERMFHGPKLELETDLSTEPGSSSFRIADTITNRGAAPQEFEILYHANYGRPLLEEGATFLAPVQRVTPFNEHAAEAVQSYGRYAGPKAGFVEQVYCLRPLAGKDGRTLVLLRNRAGDRGASMSWAVEELPYLTLWKNTAAAEDGYVTGLEPGTNFPNNRRIERQRGRVPKLAPGERHQATLDFAVHVGKDEVEGVAGRVAALQAKQSPVIDERPEKKE